LPDHGAAHADVKAISSRFLPGTLAPQFKST
jgi:ribosomal protein S2